MKRRMVYQVSVGPQRPLWQECLRSMAEYCCHHGLTHHVQSEPTLRIRPKASQRSWEAVERLGYLANCEKLAGLSFLNDYDQVAIVDADVFAAPEAPNIFDHVPTDCDVAGVTERSLPISERYRRKLDKYEKQQFGPLHGVGLPFLQCGVLVYNRSVLRFFPHGPRGFWERPELQRFINGEGPWRWQTEQVTLSWFLREHKADVHLIDPRFNWLFDVLQPGRMNEGWLHHMFLSSHLTSDDPEKMLRTGAGRPRV